MRMAYEELEQRLQGTPKVPVEISPTALALSPPTGARSTRHPTTTAPARNPVQVNVNPSLRQLVFKGPSRDPSSVPWAQGKAPGVGGFDQGTGDAREERDGGGIGRYKEPPNEHELEQAPNKGRLRRLARNGK